MAGAAGVSEATWQRIEAGATPTGETLLGIAALGFSPTWVLVGEGPMQLGQAAGAGVAPEAAEPAPLDRLFGAVKLDRLDDAFREAATHSGIPHNYLRDTNALMTLTVLLYDARTKRLESPQSEDSSDQTVKAE